jgi:hypothetical protein
MTTPHHTAHSTVHVTTATNLCPLPSCLLLHADAAPLYGAAVAYLGVEREEEFSCVLGGGPHLAVPEPELAAGELLALTTR